MDQGLDPVVQNRVHCVEVGLEFPETFVQRIRGCDDPVSGLHGVGEVPVNPVEPRFLIGGRVGSAVQCLEPFEVRLRVQNLLPQGGIRVGDIALDRGEGFIDIDFHFERGFQLRDRIGSGSIDGYLKLFIDQVVDFPDIFPERLQGVTPPVGKGDDLIAQPLEFAVPFGDQSAKPSFLAGLGKAVEFGGKSFEVGLGIPYPVDVLGLQIVDIVEHRPGGLTGVDLHLQDGLFQGLFHLDNLDHGLFDVQDLPVGDCSAERHEKDQQPETQPQLSPYGPIPRIQG